MNDNKKEEEYKKTQATSSPGALGEEVNRNNRKPSEPISKENLKTSKTEGLNEQRSAGHSGPFEGLDNTGDS